jgi:hypothetical protein
MAHLSRTVVVLQLLHALSLILLGDDRALVSGRVRFGDNMGWTVVMVWDGTPC